MCVCVEGVVCGIILYQIKFLVRRRRFIPAL